MPRVGTLVAFLLISTIPSAVGARNPGLQTIEPALHLASLVSDSEVAANATLPLHEAAFFNLASWIKELIDRGADIEARDTNGRTALMVAMASMSTEAATVLLEAGADPEARDNDGNTALHIAAFVGRVEAATLLLAKGANVAARSNHRGETPLHFAALHGNLKMIELLVSHGADPDTRDDWGIRPFHYASRRLQHSAMELLRRLGARDDNLIEAVNAEDVARVQVLLAAGADVNLTDLYGNALHRAAAANLLTIAVMLIDAGAELEAEGEPGGAHALHAAALNNHAEMARLLIERGADLEARDQQGRTPLIVASVFGSEDAADVLLAAGADPLATDGTYGETPMLLSALSGNIRIADRLVDIGVDVNHKSGHRGASPLHYAAGYGHPEMVQFLLSRGADKGAVDWRGRTPREFALTCNAVDMPSLKALDYRR